MPARPMMMPPVGKSGPGTMLHQLVVGDVGIVEHRAAGVDHLAQIVGRDVGRHADRDAGAAIDQDVREARRQHLRFLPAAVIIGLEVDRVLVDIVEQRLGRAREPRLGVAMAAGAIAVHRAEIALPVDQRQTHGKILRHAHQRVVDRGVAMRMIVAHDVADDSAHLR